MSVCLPPNYDVSKLFSSEDPLNQLRLSEAQLKDISNKANHLGLNYHINLIAENDKIQYKDINMVAKDYIQKHKFFKEEP